MTTDLLSPDERARHLYRMAFSKEPEGNTADCRFLRIAAAELRAVEEEAFRRGHDQALGEILRNELPEAGVAAQGQGPVQTSQDPAPA